MISLTKSGNNRGNFQDDNEDENSSLLGTQASSAAPASTSGQTKEIKVQGISSADFEKNRSIFQRFIFDHLKYQDYFDTTTSEVKAKIMDALWPFHPANQHHLLKNDSESVRDYQK